MAALRWHQLEGFYWVARYGNYTKAAAAFSYPIGQPAIYQQVKGLQEDMGVALVRQAGPRKTELTPEGRALYTFIAPFFEQLPGVVEQIRGGAAEPLKLAADQFLALETLPSVLSLAQKEAPDFRIQLEELGTGEIARRVIDGESDVGLLHAQGAPQGLQYEPIGRIGVALLVPRKHPLAKLDRAPTNSEIAKHPLIVYEQHSTNRAVTERMFRDLGEQLRIASEVTFSQTMRALVREGIAPAFIPFLIRSGRPIAETSNTDAAGLPKEPGCIAFDLSPRLKGSALPYGLLYRPGTQESRTFKIFVTALKKSMQG